MILLQDFASSKSSEGRPGSKLALLTGAEDSCVHFIFSVLGFFRQVTSTLRMLK